MKAYIVHMKNRFPGAIVKGDDSRVDAYSTDGNHLCSVAKNGAGQWMCNKDDSGAEHEFDLAPIPKDCRVWKLTKEGKIERDDRHEERSPISKRAAEAHGYIPSLAELEKARDPKVDLHRIKSDSNYADFEKAASSK